MRSVQDWISILRLQPHPEGGYYRETFRSGIEANIPVDGIERSRSACTVIYYLLPGESFSSFHRLKSDEVWYYHSGCPLEIVAIGKSGELTRSCLGEGEGQYLHLVIPANTWFGAFPENERAYTLVSCSVAPGFEFEDFEMASRDALLEQFPQHETWIRRLTREEN